MTWTPSSMNGNVATIGWNIAPGSLNWWSNFITSPFTSGLEIVTPDFGLFGGPGYCGGHLFGSDYDCIDDPNINIYDALYNTNPAKNSSGVYSLSDAAFKAHDIAYYEADLANKEDSTINESFLQLQADLALLQALYNVFTDSNYKMDKIEIAYDVLAAKAFEAKILAFDLVMAGVEEIKDTAVSLFNAITKSSQTYTVDHMTLPTNPSEYTPPITGDLMPIDFDPNTEGIQTRPDDWGNIITDSSQPSPGRVDTLYDTSGNDLIMGGAGDDTILTVHGGSDRIQGGAGNDNITQQSGDIPGARGTLYNSIIEGGSGSDIILGHYTVSNQLFGDSYGEMDTLIAAGETALDNGLKGDFISDYYLPEYGQSTSTGYLYGSDGRDILINNTGMGVMVGGGGDDLIYGDFDGVINANSDNTWDYTIEITTDEDGATSYASSITGIALTDNTAAGAGKGDVIYAGKIFLFRKKQLKKNIWRRVAQDENMRRIAA